MQDRHRAIGFSQRTDGSLTAAGASGCIDVVKWAAVFALILLQCSCTTLVNRRDLYSPEPEPGAIRPVAQTTTTTHTEQIEVPPQFR